jgi:hypothetical protein
MPRIVDRLIGIDGVALERYVDLFEERDPA